MSRPLFKTTITLWSEDDPRKDSFEGDLSELLAAAFDGTTHVICDTALVSAPHEDAAWDGTDAFDHLDDDDDE